MTIKKQASIFVAIIMVAAGISYNYQPVFAWNEFTCTTNPCNGTAGDDIIHGTASAESINGLGGNDIIYGNGGGDTIRGGDGNDTILGGDGNDTIYGDNGSDYLVGEAGADSIFGESESTEYESNDIIWGGTGNDNITAGGGTDTIHGEDGADRIYAGYGLHPTDGDADTVKCEESSGADSSYVDTVYLTLTGGQDSYSFCSNDTLINDYS